MRFLLTLFTLLISIFCIGQKEHHVLLLDGSKLSGERLIYERPILQSPFFSLDQQRIETSQVVFLKNNHGYFAHLDSVAGGKERYAMQIKNGRISVFEEVDIGIYGADELDVEVQDGKSTSPVLASGDALEFYTKDNGPINPAKYRYLIQDLEDNPNSLEHLKSFKTYRMLQWGTLGAGIVAAVAGLFINENGKAEFSPLVAIGIGAAGASYFYEYPKRDELWFAVEDYNKQ